MTRLACCILALCALGIALGAAAPPPAQAGWDDWVGVKDGITFHCDFQVNQTRISGNWAKFTVTYHYCVESRSLHKQSLICDVDVDLGWSCYHGPEPSTTACDGKKITFTTAPRDDNRINKWVPNQQRVLCEEAFRKARVTVEPQ